ncbi:hypothetical protein PanWU01x14_099480 [Parasponia andersonii]|uniref:Uncharacterized protein n=1 Tax=Parasponia andersonii TaxID=3476 RepID=A0A2P5D3U6_PARAD|nr:hypothetical protein PanWU01x14_099480 [Parasponia andersonii]
MVKIESFLTEEIRQLPPSEADRQAREECSRTSVELKGGRMALRHLSSNGGEITGVGLVGDRKEARAGTFGSYDGGAIASLVGWSFSLLFSSPHHEKTVSVQGRI